MKEIVDKLELINIKILALLRIMSKEWDDKPWLIEKFSKDLSNIGPWSKIYKELLKCNNKKTIRGLRWWNSRTGAHFLSKNKNKKKSYNQTLSKLQPNRLGICKKIYSRRQREGHIKMATGVIMWYKQPHTCQWATHKLESSCITETLQQEWEFSAPCQVPTPWI